MYNRLFIRALGTAVSFERDWLLNKVTLLIILSFTTFFAHTSYSLLIPVMPLYAAELGAPVSQIGLIISIYNYVPALLLLPFGILSDRIGHNKLLATGLVIFAAAPSLYPLATTIPQLFLVRAFHGLAMATYVPAAFASAAELAPANRRGETLGWFTMALQSGMMAGPVLGGFHASDRLQEPPYVGFDFATDFLFGQLAVRAAGPAGYTRCA